MSAVLGRRIFIKVSMCWVVGPREGKHPQAAENRLAETTIIFAGFTLALYSRVSIL